MVSLLTKKWAYYNDNDPFVCAWVRELMKRDLVAPGEVDERSIEDVQPEDVRPFTQAHFFCGIAVWSYALRRAGWPDSRPVWTGSCPCPPFSSAGIKKACPQCQGTNPVPHVGRTGYFVCCLCDHEWFADARHLWPELWRLISVCRPVTLFGEQVAGDDGKTWLALVRASLEILGYAVGAKDLCSAGFGASDIRQRLYFVAHTVRTRRAKGWTIAGDGSLASGGATGSLEYTAVNRRPRRTGETGIEPQRTSSRTPQQRLGETGELGDSNISRPQRYGRPIQQHDSQRREIKAGCITAAGGVIELADTDSLKSGNGELQRSRRLLQPSENPLAGFWRDAEWIYCQDEKWRPVEPGTFPLVNGTPNRVGRLRGYGNAINAEVAKGFIEAYMSLER